MDNLMGSFGPKDGDNNDRSDPRSDPGYMALMQFAKDITDIIPPNQETGDMPEDKDVTQAQW